MILEYTDNEGKCATLYEDIETQAGPLGGFGGWELRTIDTGFNGVHELAFIEVSGNRMVPWHAITCAYVSQDS